MSIAAIWDRLWWSAMWTVFIGLIWLKFVDPLFPYIVVGFIVSGAVGAAYFVVGIHRMLQVKHREEEIEKKAREELIAEFKKEAAR
ncbi:MAG: hypothetical protein ACM3YE_03980 [Bacteroidota bacterium]